MISFLQLIGLNFLLSFIPQEFLYITLIIILGVFIWLIYFLNKYIKFCYILFCLILLSLYFYHQYEIEKIHKYYGVSQEELQNKITELEKKSAQITTKTITKYVEKVKIIREKNNDLKKFAREKINSTANDKCIIPNAFIWLHDKAARDQDISSTRINDSASTTTNTK